MSSSSTSPSNPAAAAAASSSSSDPVLQFLRSMKTMITSQNQLETAQAELTKKRTALRHQPARLVQESPKLREMETNIKQAEHSFAAQEKQCAQLLRSLLQTASGTRPRNTGERAGAAAADESHSDHKPGVSFFDLLDVRERLEDVQRECSRITSIKDNSIAALKGVSALRDILAHAAELSKDAFPPEYFLGASTASDPLARGPNPNPPMLAMEHETMARRLARTHLGLLFAAARRDTMSPGIGGHFQFVPSAAGPFGNRANEDPAPINPAVSNLAVTPFDSPTTPEFPAQMARRIDELGADLLEIAQAVMETQEVVEHQQNRITEIESLLQLALLTGLQTREQVREAIQTFADLSLDSSAAPSAPPQGRASGLVASVDDDDEDDDDDDSDEGMITLTVFAAPPEIQPVPPHDRPGPDQHSGSMQPKGPTSSSATPDAGSFRVKQEPMD